MRVKNNRKKYYLLPKNLHGIMMNSEYNYKHDRQMMKKT